MFLNSLGNILPPDSLRARFAKGTFWSVVGVSISQGLALLGWIVVARILGKEGFGQLAIVQSTVGMLGVIAGLGLGLTATKHVAELRDSNPERAGRIISLTFVTALITGGLSAIILLTISPYISVQTIGAPQLTSVLRIGCWLLFFNTFFGVATGALAGFEAFKTIAKVSLVAGLVKVFFMTVGVLYWALPGVVCAMVIAAAVSGAVGYFALLKKAHEFGTVISCQNIQSELPILWSFSIPGCLSSAMVPPVIWITHAILVHQAEGFAEMGLFHAATRFQAPLRLIGSTTGAALLPILVSIKNRTSNSTFERANILISWFLGAIPAIIFITFPEILSLLFGRQYSGIAAHRVLSLVMLYTTIILYKQGLARVLAANNLMWWSVLSNGVWAVVLLFSFYWFRHLGALGLAVSLLLAYIVNVLVFIPLYASRNLIPRDTMLSWRAAIIWTAIFCPAILSFLGISLAVRIAALLLVVSIILFVFRDLIRNKRNIFSPEVGLAIE